MGKTKKPPVVLHECRRYKDEVIEKLKTKDWEESDGLYLDSTHTVLFLHDKDAALKLVPFLSEYETAEFFTLLNAPYKEWRHVKATPYNKDYALNPSLIIELIRILYGGFSANIMGEVIIGFLPTAKPIIVSIPYKDDRAVFIIAPALTPDGLEETEIYGEQHELDYTIGDKPAYYDLERQIFGFCVDGEIISMDEYREQVRSKIEPPKIPEKVKVEEKVKVRVLEDIPTFMGTDGEIYKLNKDDIVELPKTNADVLCKRGVMGLFVEIIPPEKPVPEKVEIHGILKTRYRCPVCYRAAPGNFCMVHSDVESIDLLAADEPVKEAVIDLTFLDLFKAKHPEKKRWTIDELHDAMGIDTAYAPGFLAKPRIPETYAQYYARELGVEIEEITPPEVVEAIEEEELKRISEALALAKQKPFGARPVEDVLFFPSVIIIAGKRRSGKTAIGFYILEIAPVANKFVLGMPEHVWGYLPEEIKPLPLTAEILEELPVDSIFLIDEASLSFYAKKHRSNLSAIIDAITLKSAQRGQTFIFVSHNLRKLQPNIILESDILLFKEPSLMQVEMERREIKSRMKKVKEGFDEIPAPERVRFCYMFSDDFTGLTINPLPSFWRVELSEVWREYTAQAEMEELANGYEETIERRIAEEVRPPLLLEKEFVPTPPRKYTPPITQISAAMDVSVSTVWDQGGNLDRAAWLVHAGVEDALVVQENYRSNWNYLPEELQHKLIGEV